MYWDITSGYEPVAHAMSRDKFQTLKKYLHFVDNHSAPSNVQDESKDRLFKIRPLFEPLKKNCVKQIPEEHNSIDEQMIPFKGRSFLRHYMPNKLDNGSIRTNETEIEQYLGILLRMCIVKMPRY